MTLLMNMDKFFLVNLSDTDNDNFFFVNLMDKSMKMFPHDHFVHVDTPNPILFNCVPCVMWKAVGLGITRFAGNLKIWHEISTTEQEN